MYVDRLTQTMRAAGATVSTSESLLFQLLGTCLVSHQEVRHIPTLKPSRASSYVLVLTQRDTKVRTAHAVETLCS